MKPVSSICIFVFCLVGSSAEKYTEDYSNKIGNHPTISIPDGKVRGKMGRTVGQRKVYYAFLGIPYAEPPTGDRRFKPPEKKSKWIGTIDATQDKSQCLQFANPPRGSEDCLYINVYTPKLQGKKMAVMVWIHGGAFAFGNSSNKNVKPDHLLEEDIVFVSLNYRLGIFGFGSTRDSACPGNFGLKDQIMALKWIQHNIGFFGGDPGKVTISGQSAGSASVSYLLQTDLAKDLFRAAIMESATSLCVWALDRKSRKTMFAVGKAFNISTSSSAVLIDGLRKINSGKLQEKASLISSNVTLTDFLGGIVFGPVPEPGVVKTYSEQALSEGRFQRKPVIIGLNSNEIATLGDWIGITSVRDYFRRYENTTLIVPVDLTKNKTKILQAASRIRTYYFGASPTVYHTDTIIKFLSDDLFNRPIRRTVTDQSKYAPVYFYKFSHVGRLGSPANRTFEGVGHNEELSYLFERYVDVNVTAPPNDKLIRSRMVKLWTNFVKFMNPTPTRDPLFENIKWLTSNTEHNKQLYLNIDTNMGLQQNMFERNMKFWDKIYKELGDPPYDTY